jgi:hypothetical protein
MLSFSIEEIENVVQKCYKRRYVSMPNYLIRIDDKLVKKSEDLFESLNQIHVLSGYTGGRSLLYPLGFLPRAILNLLKFKKGDRVFLKSAPDMGMYAGWKSDAHFLIPGSPGTVESAGVTLSDFSKDPEKKDLRLAFSYDVSFDNESFFNMNGECCSIKDRHTYRLDDDQLTSEAIDSECNAVSNDKRLETKSYTLGGNLVVLLRESGKETWEVVWDNGQPVPRVPEEKPICKCCGR